MAEEAVTKKVKCTYPGCKLVFKSEKEMKHHKKFDSEHAYCDECEEDFEDEERLLIHKIKSVKHIVCPVCGIDFGSDGGRNSHIRQIIPCHGCKTTFKSASGAVEEDDDQGALGAGEGMNMPIIPLQGTLEDTEYDDADGGVMLETGEAASRALSNREALNNQLKPGRGDPTASVSAMLALKHWPNLDGKASKGKSVAPSELLAVSDLSISAATGKENNSWKGKEPVRSMPDAVSFQRPFGIGTLRPGDTLRMLDRAWDATKFFDSFAGQFVCPCKKGFSTMTEFENHVLMKSRMMEDRQCPGCLRFFKTTAALVAHLESPSTRCNLSDGERYGQIFEEITGGLIQTAGYTEDGRIKYEAGKLEITDGLEPATTTVGTDLRQRPQRREF
ncbi:C2H2 finger domain protein [Aspergillus arachidicola]|uniref:C2H2 finger domain protein n=1 Tax=Aspergillus arachidicola TaxID=656916 RepID=A0A2G7FND5_9EURO|nr:C2H2 finger domain protein [Aspergillus arachidicola]